MESTTTQRQMYAYSGPLSGVTLNVDGAELDVLLNPRQPVALPPEHPYTLALIAQKRLIPVLPAPLAEPANLPPPALPKGKAKPSINNEE